MANVINLKRQHTEITELVRAIKELINKNNIENEANEIAKNINILSGKLKIHLNSEDRFLYPELLNNKNDKLKSMARGYIKDMADISSVFMKYKDKFNTKSKIIVDIDKFKKESEQIIKVLSNRINKEDRELYPLISENPWGQDTILPIFRE